MEETDVERVLAAAAPETVPTVVGLAERARTAGRRKRRQRAVMTGGGAGVALAGVVGAVAVFGGGVGAGQSARVSSDPGYRAGSAVSSSATATPTAPPTQTLPLLGLPPGVHIATLPTPTIGHVTDDPGADANLLAAVKAALPAADGDKVTLYRAAGSANGYGGEFNWGPRSQQSTLGVAVSALSTVKGTPSLCQIDKAHCTTGTGTVHGDPVTWEYYDSTASDPGLNIYDTKAGVNYFISASGPDASHLPGLTELKDIGLNDQVATALLAGWPKK